MFSGAQFSVQMLSERGGEIRTTISVLRIVESSDEQWGTLCFLTSPGLTGILRHSAPSTLTAAGTPPSSGLELGHHLTSGAKWKSFGTSPAWQFIPRAAVEVSAVALLEDSTPLLEEEGDTCVSALIADVDHPVLFHRTSSRP